MLKLIHFTDIHVMSDPHKTLLGVNTTESLNAVLHLMKQCHLNPDLYLLTGDLIQDDRASSYQVASRLLKNLDKPLYWIPGNHDLIELQQGVFQGPMIHADKSILKNEWQIILLNSAVWGQTHGYLAKTELDFLTHRLKEYPDLHALICMHHNPVQIDCAWLDPIGLENSEEFWETIASFKQIKGVLWGHIHQDFEGERNGIRLLATPSTCIQFKPKTSNFALDEKPPGFRYLELKADGSIQTHVLRATQYTMKLDLNATGY